MTTTELSEEKYEDAKIIIEQLRKQVHKIFRLTSFQFLASVMLLVFYPADKNHILFSFLVAIVVYALYKAIRKTTRVIFAYLLCKKTMALIKPHMEGK